MALVKKDAKTCGIEISALGPIPKKLRKDVQIEVVSMTPTDKGVDVFARAWSKDGKQFGFGKDGSVDIERFRFINPTTLVPDGTKSFVTLRGVETEVDNHKEDHMEAVLQMIEDTVSVKKEKFVDSNIVAGKTGNTTTTVYPGTNNPGSVSVDETVQHDTGQTSWATQIGTMGTFTSYGATGTVLDPVFMRCHGVADTWEYNAHSYFHFDTSGIPDGDIISSATFSVYVISHSQVGSNNPTIGLYASTVSSNTTVAANGTDFGSVGSTLYSDSPPSQSSLTNSQLNNWVLNATGIAAISKTGVTKLATRMHNYDTGASTPPDVTTGDTYFRVYSSDNGSNRPQLVIEHSAPVAQSAIFMGCAM